MLSRSIDFNNKSFDCKICVERGYYKERNCNGDLLNMKPEIRDKTVRFNINNEILNYCPKILLHDEDVLDAIRLFVYWDKGIMLVNGGVEDQPFWYYLCMLELNEVKIDYERKQLDNNK